MFAAKGGTARSRWWRSAVAGLAALLLASFVGGIGGVATARGADPESAGLSPEQQRVENVLAAARQYLGVPYRVGSEGPSLFDCSGLVFRAFSDAGLVDRIGGARLRAAGYMRLFARQGLMTASEEEARRGDLVIYDRGKHIGFYLGDGRTISALVTGVTVHSLHGINQEVTGFLRPDWSGEGQVPPFEPVELPDIAEAPAVLIPARDWLPALADVEPIEREGTERIDMRTPSTRTFENRDGTFTTEFHAQPIHYAPEDDAGLVPIDLSFQLDDRAKTLVVSSSPVHLVARRSDHMDGLLSATAGEQSVTLRLAGRGASGAKPVVAGDGHAADYFDLMPGGIGLRVLAAADGFSGFLVLAGHPERNRFSFELDAPGLTASLDETGGILLLDEDSAVVGRIPRPMLLDSSDSDGTGGGLFAGAASLEVIEDDGRTLITVIVRPRALDEAAYPAFIDLSLVEFPASPPPADMAIVSSRNPDAAIGDFARPEEAADAELWFGRQPRTRNEAQAFLRFNELVPNLGTVDVAAAALELLPYLQQAEDVAALVSRVAGDWNATTLTWNLRPERGTEVGSIAATAGQWASLDVSAYAADVLSRGIVDMGLVLHGEDGAPGTWKRIVGTAMGPRLVVTWSGLRPAPVGPAEPAADGPDQAVADAQAGEPMSFAWTLPQIAGAQKAYQLQISADDFATLELDTGKVNREPGQASEWALPQDTLTRGGDYQWRVRVRTGTGDSWTEWSTPQPFTIVAPAPALTVPEKLPLV